MLMKHLQGGVKKGAFDEAAAQKKFDAWKADKEKVLAGISEKNKSAEAAKVKARLDAEKAINKARAAELSKKRSPQLKPKGLKPPKKLQPKRQAKAEETSKFNPSPAAG